MEAETVRYVVGGAVQASDGTYLERHADGELLERCRAGEFVYILTARQLGKSSLMVRVASALTREHAVVAMVDLQSIGTPTDAEQWYRGVLLDVTTQILAQVDIALDLAGWWREHEALGVTQRFNLYFQDLIGRLDRQLVVFVDEIDTTLSLDYTDDFFIAIRHLYGARAQNRRLSGLSFVLIGVASPDALIKSVDRTPFNIGHRVELTDFEEHEARRLLDGLDLRGAQGDAVLRRILYWTGGHPYLTQKIFRELATRSPEVLSDSSIDDVVQRLFLVSNSPRGPDDPNLQFVHTMLTERVGTSGRALLIAYRRLLSEETVLDSAQSWVAQRLKLSGVATSREGLLVVRNRIYATAFDRDWIASRLPTNWRALSAVLATLLVVVGIGAFVAIDASRAAGRWRDFAADVAGRKTERETAASLVSESWKRATDAAREPHAVTEFFGLLAQIARATEAGENGLDADDVASLVSQASRVHHEFWMRRGKALREASARARSTDLDAYLLLATGGARRDGRGVDAEVVAAFRQAYAGLRSIIPGDGTKVLVAEFSSDGREVAFGTLARNVHRWSTRDGSALGPPLDASHVPGFAPYALAYVAGENGVDDFLIAASREGAIPGVMWPLPRDGRRVSLPRDVLWRGMSQISDLVASPDGSMLLAVGWDIRLVGTGGARQRTIARSGGAMVTRSAAFRPDGEAIVIAFDTGPELWNTSLQRIGSQFTTRTTARSRQINAVQFSPDGRWLVVAPAKGPLEVWRVSDRKLIKPIAFTPQAGGGATGRHVVLRAGFCNPEGTAKDSVHLVVVGGASNESGAVVNFEAQRFALRMEDGGVLAAPALHMQLANEVVLAISSTCEMATAVHDILRVRSFDERDLPHSAAALQEAWAKLLRKDLVALETAVPAFHASRGG